MCVCLYVKFVCVCEIIGVVCGREAAGGEGVPEKEPGIQNQKQEPHTKLWGIIFAYHMDIYIYIIIYIYRYVLSKEV